MAKHPRTPAQLAALARLNARPRDAAGRPLSNDALKSREKEHLQRLVDLTFMTPTQRARANRAMLRANEVKEEKQARNKRYRQNPKAYKRQANPDKVTLASADEINAERLPKPAHTIKHGDLTEHVWVWQGQHALQTAKDFLYLANEKMPADTRGYLAIGNGYGSNVKWVGTRYGTPLDVVRHANNLEDSKSEEVTELMSLIAGDENWGNESRSVRVEVKLTTQGRLSYGKGRGSSKKKA